jgi:hypothetical protein
MIKKYLFIKNIPNYFLVIFIFFLSYFFSKYSLFHDINSFYTNLLRIYEGQILFKDYFCHFFSIQFYFLSPLLNFLDIENFTILTSIFLNFLFAFQFAYFSKKILIKEINFFYLFIILSFFFIPFGIGVAHHNEYAIYFCSIGTLMAINNLEKINYLAVIYLVIGLTIKYSIAIPLFFSIFLSFSIILIFNFKKEILIIFIKYILLIAFIFQIIVFLYLLNLEIKIIDLFSYLFFDTISLSENRFTFKDIIFYNRFSNIFNFIINFKELSLLPVGSILQLPIILAYFYFIVFFLINLKNYSLKEKLFFYFLIFSSIFLIIFLGRDWNHKYILMISTVYMLFFYFYRIDKKFSNFKINLVIFCLFIFYLTVPINERIPLKDLVKNFEPKIEKYFFKLDDTAPNIALKRSKFEDRNGINNLSFQYRQISSFLLEQKDLNLFFVDDLSTIFSTLLAKAPSDSGCFHAWMLTPPINENIKREWINVYLTKYNQSKNGKLIVCKTENGKLCLYNLIKSEEGASKEVGPTDINDNIFIKNLISNSKVVFNTKNFYVYEKK